ncbi:response regulator [Roseiflexus castenholzii]|jgi:DNA-binding NarL/FixJ family response regulator|uniref:Response regulator receiver protein n=1 Tax=Roseiflexus castenholzii (strain DSM 13941 / HLO8) TaxID=383372 RepID=A7NIZ2_ROSCS|nr:response regulator [Roseiflexus castenholzii]ABU57450.1 response regulator receiver protein [Roseiflexus castenholzii DSM 13941]
MECAGAQSPDRVRTLVAAPHEEYRLFGSALKRLPQAVVVAATDNGRTALEYVRRMRFDLAIIGIPLAHANGLTVARQALHTSPDIRIVMITAIDDPACLLEAIRVGVHGYLSTTASIDELADAIPRILAGETIFDILISTRALRRLVTSGCSH